MFGRTSRCRPRCSRRQYVENFNAPNLPGLCALRLQREAPALHQGRSLLPWFSWATKYSRVLSPLKVLSHHHRLPSSRFPLLLLKVSWKVLMFCESALAADGRASESLMNTDKRLLHPLWDHGIVVFLLFQDRPDQWQRVYIEDVNQNTCSGGSVCSTSPKLFHSLWLN